MKNLLNKIKDFILCFLMDNCPYSIKKLLVYIFSIVAIYIIIFTVKDYVEILGFIAILLGLRSYERLNDKKPIEKG